MENGALAIQGAVGYDDSGICVGVGNWIENK